MSEVEAGPGKVSLFELAWTFNHIALASFGGGLSAWSREVLVVEKHWMGEEEFLSAMTMCRILPGHTYLQLAGLFASLSLLSIGGGNAVLPEMHLQAVKGHHWMTDSQFADIFSISQTAPGPSILIVTLVGYGAGSPSGASPEPSSED
jgi:chromate transport protein ChrA